MRVLLALGMMAVLAAPVCVFAQDDHVPRYGEEDKEKSIQQKQSDRDSQRAYERSLRNIPDKGGTSDPWGGVRNGDAPKTAETAPKPKKSSTKTGTAN